MSMGVKVKICKIIDVHTAMVLDSLSVDFIGLHAIWELNPDKEALYKNIIKAVKKTKPVIVTRTKDFNVLGKIVNSLRPDFIQLHSNWNREELKKLKFSFELKQHYIPKIIGVVALENSSSIRLIDEIFDLVDFILFDRSFRGGTGIQIEENILRNSIQIIKSYGVPFFIAGGLTPENVGHYVKSYKPYGVDVQSGVEIDGAPGFKDYIKVKKFVEEVRKYEALAFDRQNFAREMYCR